MVPSGRAFFYPLQWPRALQAGKVSTLRWTAYCKDHLRQHIIWGAGWPMAGITRGPSCWLLGLACRVYYSCAEKETLGCKARKIVDRPKERQWRGDSICDVVTIDGEHNHPPLHLSSMGDGSCNPDGGLE